MKRIIAAALLMVMCVTVGAQYRKSVSILGDSYSTFEGFLKPDTNWIWYFAQPRLEKTDVTSVRQTWWHKYISENGYRLCVNNSYSGSTICATGYNKEDYYRRSFFNRADDLGCPDVIFIFGGTNDSWAGSPIGEYKYGGWTREELYSFRPAMAKLLSRMIDLYPNVELYFILNDCLKPEINESVEVICEHYNVPLIKLEGIDKMDGHPSIKGMEQICSQVEQFVRGVADGK